MTFSPLPAVGPDAARRPVSMTAPAARGRRSAPRRACAGGSRRPTTRRARARAPAAPPAASPPSAASARVWLSGRRVSRSTRRHSAPLMRWLRRSGPVRDPLAPRAGPHPVEPNHLRIQRHDVLLGAVVPGTPRGRSRPPCFVRWTCEHLLCNRSLGCGASGVWIHVGESRMTCIRTRPRAGGPVVSGPDGGTSFGRGQQGEQPASGGPNVAWHPPGLSTLVAVAAVHAIRWIWIGPGLFHAAVARTASRARSSLPRRVANQTA